MSNKSRPSASDDDLTIKVWKLTGPHPQIGLSLLKEVDQQAKEKPNTQQEIDMPDHQERNKS